MIEDQNEFFKICQMCGRKWENRAAFLDDPELEFIGYQPCFGMPEKGLFCFNHKAEGCGSTLALHVAAFLSLYAGEHYPDIRMNTEECRGYCLNIQELQRCEARCRYAFVREVSQIIRDHKEGVDSAEKITKD